MIDNTDPADLHDTETDTEQRMRADFMHARHIADRIDRDPESYDPADSVEHAEYASPWLNIQEWSRHWLYLSEATDRWTADATAARRLAQARETSGYTTPIETRSEDQARHIAEHGIQRDPWGLLISPYVTRVEDRGAPAPSDDRFIAMTDPRYYDTAGSEDERQLRADFVRYLDELNQAGAVIDPDAVTGDGPEAEGHARVADGIAARWETQEAWREVWDHLDATTVAVERDPGSLARIREVAVEQAVPVDPIRWRNYQQAAELTGHGTWDTTPGAAGRDQALDAVEIKPAAPVPVSSVFAAARTRELAAANPTVSPLANYQPGNAIAVALANSERDGIDR